MTDFSPSVPSFDSKTESDQGGTVSTLRHRVVMHQMLSYISVSSSC